MSNLNGFWTNPRFWTSLENLKQSIQLKEQSDFDGKRSMNANGSLEAGTNLRGGDGSYDEKQRILNITLCMQERSEIADDDGGSMPNNRKSCHLDQWTENII